MSKQINMRKVMVEYNSLVLADVLEDRREYDAEMLYENAAGNLTKEEAQKLYELVQANFEVN